MPKAQGMRQWLAIGTQSALSYEDDPNPATLFDHVPIRTGGLQFQQPTMYSEETYGFEQRHGRPGLAQAVGTLGFRYYHEGFDKLFDNDFTVASTEVASIVINGTNEKFNFNIGAGELTATLTNGTVTLASIAADLQTKMRAVGAGNENCSYSYVTRKLTVSKDAGTLNILWKTGTNGADGTDTHCGTVLGYLDTADDTGSLSYAADNVVAAINDNVYNPNEVFPNNNGLTLDENKDLKLHRYHTMFGTALGFALAEGQPYLDMSYGFIGFDHEERTAASPTFSTLTPANPHGNITVAATINGQAFTEIYFKTLNLNITIPTVLSYWAGSKYAVGVERSGKLAVTGNFGMPYNNDGSPILHDNWLTAWKAGTVGDITFTFNGAVVRNSIKRRLVLAFRAIHLMGQDPVVGGPQTIPQVFDFGGAYDISNARTGLQITTRNTINQQAF
jgi:hypothetical protein